MKDAVGKIKFYDGLLRINGSITSCISSSEMEDEDMSGCVLETSKGIRYTIQKERKGEKNERR